MARTCIGLENVLLIGIKCEHRPGPGYTASCWPNFIDDQKPQRNSNGTLRSDDITNNNNNNNYESIGWQIQTPPSTIHARRFRCVTVCALSIKCIRAVCTISISYYNFEMYRYVCVCVLAACCCPLADGTYLYWPMVWHAVSGTVRTYAFNLILLVETECRCIKSIHEMILEPQNQSTSI